MHASPAGVFCKGEKMVVVLSRHFEEIEKAIASASNKETGTGDILCAILYATALIYIDRLEIIDRETEKLENIPTLTKRKKHKVRIIRNDYNYVSKY